MLFLLSMLWAWGPCRAVKTKKTDLSNFVNSPNLNSSSHMNSKKQPEENGPQWLPQVCLKRKLHFSHSCAPCAVQAQCSCLSSYCTNAHQFAKIGAPDPLKQQNKCLEISGGAAASSKYAQKGIVILGGFPFLILVVYRLWWLSAMLVDIITSSSCLLPEKKLNFHNTGLFSCLCK